MIHLRQRLQNYILGRNWDITDISVPEKNCKSFSKKIPCQLKRFGTPKITNSPILPLKPFFGLIDDQCPIKILDLDVSNQRRESFVVISGTFQDM